MPNGGNAFVIKKEKNQLVTLSEQLYGVFLKIMHNWTYT